MQVFCPLKTKKIRRITSFKIQPRARGRLTMALGAEEEVMATNDGNGNSTQTRIPRTITSKAVWGWNITLLFISYVICSLLLSPFFKEGNNWLAGGLIALLGLGIAIFSGIITEEIPDFHGVLLFNPWARTRRVLFPGLSLKLPWEKVEHENSGAVVLTSLVRTVSTKETKTHPTNDPAENMETSLLIHMRVNTLSSDEEAAENFIRFRSIKEEALIEIVRVEAEKMFAEYYGGQEMEDLLKPHVIQEKVLKLEDNDKKIKEMENKNGVSIGIVLESSKPDLATQNMKRTPAMAEALDSAIKKLVAGGMDPELAGRRAMILDPTNDYSEERFDLHINAPDLKNLQHASFMGFGEKGKGGKK